MVKKKVAAIITSAVVMTSVLSINGGSTVYAKSCIGKDGKTTITTTSAVKENSYQAKITQDKAMALLKEAVKNYFNYTLDAKGFSIRYNLSKDGTGDTYEWSISMDKSDSANRTNISADINADTGEITALRKYDWKQESSAEGKLSRAKAKTAAQDFLNKFFGDKAKECELINYNSDIDNSSNYYFDFGRYENGVLCKDDYVNIEVDNHTGNIIGFDYNWEKNLKVPDSSKVISQDGAKEAFVKNMKPELRYIPFRDKYAYSGSSADDSAKLAYDISNLQVYRVDANSGKFIDGTDEGGFTTVNKDLTASEKAAWYEKAGTVVSNDKEIDENQAEKVMKKYIKDIYGTGYTIDDVSYSKDSDDYYGSGNGNWTADFYKKSKKDKDYIENSISIDALTESILYVSDYKDKNKEAAPKVSLDSAYKKAVDLIPKYYPGEMKLITTKIKYTTTKDSEGRYYSFNFSRQVNGVSYDDNGIFITIDNVTGDVAEITYRWDAALKFDSPNGIKNSTEAAEAAMEKYVPTLVYGKFNGKEALAYVPMDKEDGSYYPYIDAVTGKTLDYDGNELPVVSTDFLNQIKGSKYEDALTDLAYGGIIDTSNFQMNRNITKLEFYKMLVNAKGYNVYAVSDAPALKYSDVSKSDSGYKYLQLAVYYGFLDNSSGKFDENAPITREDMAVVFMKVLGYTNISNDNDIFKLNTADQGNIDPNKVGAVAMAKALGILSEDSNLIRPKDNASMTEAAVAIYNVLGNIRG